MIDFTVIQVYNKLYWKAREDPSERNGRNMNTMERKRISAILLAGGKSSRMGRDKAALPVQGMTLLEWQIQKLRGLGIGDIMLSGSNREMEGVRTVQDRFPERGPLGGLHACLKAARNPDCLVLSVDVPLVPPPLLAELVRLHQQKSAAVTLLRHGDRLEPLIGVYQSALFRRAESILQGEHTAVRRLLDETGFQLLDWPGDEAFFLNCNTPEDYARLQTLAGSTHF